MRFISAAIFSACCRTSLRSVPTTRTAIGVSEPKLMTLVTISPGSKPKVAILACRSRLRLGQSSLLQPLGQPRDHPLGEDLAEPLAELGELDPAVLAQGDAQLAVVGPAHEEHHVVDAEVRGDLAHVAHRDLDVLGLRLVLDLLEALHRHLPGQLEVRAGRRPEPEHELPRVDLGEQLGADLQPQQPEDQAARRRDRPEPPTSAGGRTSPRPCR